SAIARREQPGDVRLQRHVCLDEPAIVANDVQLDDRGFIETDVALQTNVAGLFAAGDCRAGSTKQAASAAGEGAAAALAIRRYIQPLSGGMPEHNVAATPA
ncbi:MAG: hypothetical protein EPO22_03420, partial [Dehalococcoidia bacterium]